MIIIRKRSVAWVFSALLFLLVYLWHHSGTSAAKPVPGWRLKVKQDYLWRSVPTHFPPLEIKPLPDNATIRFPRTQVRFPPEKDDFREQRVRRQQAVKRLFVKSWEAYKAHAWMSDELSPVSGGRKNGFGGWAATLVDSLDTLWIMDMKEDFSDVVAAAQEIDFTRTRLDQINVFETTIRYLGGFLSAYDLSGDVRLLRKAVEVGDMLYKAFDTPNRMPITRWDLHAAAKGTKQTAPSGILLAELGSLSMEFTRLSILTADPKWFDATHRITEELAAQQDSSALPGLWPLSVNAKDLVFDKGTVYSLGAMADSTYEYLPKMAALLGGQLPIYKSMYEKAADAASKYCLFRPMTPTLEDILIAGIAHTESDEPKGPYRAEIEPLGQHLSCYVGGMYALGGSLFRRAEDMETAIRLVRGCIWTYKAFPHGVMPETFKVIPCDSKAGCAWSDKKWKEEVVKEDAKKNKDAKSAAVVLREADEVIEKDHLPKAFTSVPDRRYILRPEAIESVFVLYRTTGKRRLLDSAWDMFLAIDNATSTELANSAVRDVTVEGEAPQRADSMESFWLGETLKYFYLTFSEPSLISLDEYVFNTEAHPFRRLQ